MYESRAYDNQHGDPVVVLVTTGTHDVSRLVQLLNGRGALVEQLMLGDKVVRQLKRHNAGRAALALLKAHGGADFTDEESPTDPAKLRTTLDALASAQQRIAELEDLGIERHAEMLVNEVRLRSLEIRNGGFKMEMDEARELAAIYVACARTMLGDAENYTETPIEFHVKIAERPEKYILTVQRTEAGKLTPHEARLRAEAERDQARAQLRALGADQ